METRYSEEQVRTAQYTLIIDRLRQRFRRIPSGSDPTDPGQPVTWLPYHAAWRDPRTGALTLALDPAGTHLLRVGP